MDCWAFTTSQRQLCFLFFFLPVKNKHNLRINQFHYLDNKLHLIADYNQIHIIELSSLVTPPSLHPSSGPAGGSTSGSCFRCRLMRTFLTASLHVMLQLANHVFQPEHGEAHYTTLFMNLAAAGGRGGRKKRFNLRLRNLSPAQRKQQQGDIL